MALKKEEVEKTIKWTGEWKIVFVRSKNDYMKVRNGSPTSAFWDLWREKKSDIKALGISVRKEENEEEETFEWVISAWDETTAQEKTQAKEDWDAKMAQRQANQDRNDGDSEN